MNLLIREFRAGEESEIQKIGMSAFRSLEGVFISKPKTAKVAVVDGQLAGAMYYQMYPYGENKKLCYLAYAFVDPRFHGQGVGTKLYQETIKYVRSQGCEVITALVKGDNVGSFHPLEQCGLKKCSMRELAKLIGIKAVLTIFWKTEHNIAMGMDFYCTDVKEKQGSGKELVTYLLLNMAILLLSYWSRKAMFLPFLLAAGSVFAFVALLGGLISLFSKQRWQFRLNNCGLMISMAIAAIGGVFPMIGRWYPKEYSREKAARRELCISAAIEWAGLMIAIILVGVFAPEKAYWNGVKIVADNMLVYRMIPTYPFCEYGGNRIWKYNKVVYGVFFVITAVLLYFF